MPHHRTLPHKLRRLGYTTGLVGLWHLGTPESNLGKKLTRQVPHLPISPYISPYLPISPCISLAGKKLTRQVRDAPAAKRAVRWLSPLYSPCPLWQVRDAPAAKWAVAAGGKVKRAVVAEYASVQEHVRQVVG